MKISNIDNTIRERLQNRTLQPSDSAWDRLAVQLDEQPKKAKKIKLNHIKTSQAINIILIILVILIMFH